MSWPVRSSALLLAVILVAVAMAASGCSNPLGSPAPSVTVTAPYVAPSPTPLPLPTEMPTPTPTTSWTGTYVKLYGNVSTSGGDRVYGTVKIHYLDKNYWDDVPSAQYDTANGGAYSVKVRANVSFRPEFGYYYVGKLPTEMYTRLLDKMVIQNDTSLDFSAPTSNITPVK